MGGLTRAAHVVVALAFGCGRFGFDATIDATTDAGWPPGCPVRALTTGAGHTCAIDPVGTLRCWGDNSNGQIGDGTYQRRFSPVVVELGGPARGVASGKVHTCAVRDDGRVWCWGGNSYAQLGQGAVGANSTSPVEVQLPEPIIDVRAGGRHTCALAASGGMYCWGRNDNGEIGDGTTTTAVLPVQVDTAARAVAAGHAFTCVVRTDESLWCWGDGRSGQLGTGTFASMPTPSQVALGGPASAVAGGGRMTCAARTDGTTVCFGDNTIGQLGTTPSPDTALPGPPVVADALSLVGGARHSCALSREGVVSCWGENDAGQLGDGTLATRTAPVIVARDVATLAAGYHHTCIVPRAGGLYCAGSNATGQHGLGMRSTSPSPVKVPLPAAAVEVAAARWSTCARLTSGAVWCWGSDTFGLGDQGQENVGTPMQVQLPGPATGLASVATFSCATVDAQLYCWGSNTSGQLGAGMTSVPRDEPTRVPVPGTVTAAGLANSSACAQSSSGAYCWGDNSAGQIAEGTTIDRLTPTLMNPQPSAAMVEIVGGRRNVCARFADATIGCWGSNAEGQVGDGTTTARRTPNQVALGEPALDVAMGFVHACAIGASGTARCWGANNDGQLGDGTSTMRLSPTSVPGLSGLTSIGAGWRHTCATTATEIWCWGDNGMNQLGPNASSSPTRTPVRVDLPEPPGTSITGGEHFTCALGASGSVYCWGINERGQLGDGSARSQAAFRAVDLGCGL